MRQLIKVVCANPAGEFGVDASFHSAEWHAARIAALTTERLTWDEWKEQQKEHLMSEEAVVRCPSCLLQSPVSLRFETPCVTCCAIKT